MGWVLYFACLLWLALMLAAAIYKRGLTPQLMILFAIISFTGAILLGMLQEVA